MSLSSVGEKFELCLTSTYLLELFVAEYIREININFYLSLMFICTLQFQVLGGGGVFPSPQEVFDNISACAGWIWLKFVDFS